MASKHLASVLQELLYDLKDQKPIIDGMAEGKDEEYRRVLLGAYEDAYSGLRALYFAAKADLDS